jgi:hypothetical protein
MFRILALFLPLHLALANTPPDVRLQKLQEAYLFANWPEFSREFETGIKDTQSQTIRNIFFEFYEAAKKDKSQAALIAAQSNVNNIQVAIEVNHPIQRPKAFHLVAPGNSAAELEKLDVELPPELREGYLNQRFFGSGTGRGFLMSQPSEKPLPTGLYKASLKQRGLEPLPFSFLITPNAYRILELSLIEPKQNLILKKSEPLKLKIGGGAELNREIGLFVTFVDPTTLSAKADQRQKLPPDGNATIPVQLPPGNYDVYIQVSQAKTPGLFNEADIYYRWVVPLLIQ